MPHLSPSTFPSIIDAQIRKDVRGVGWFSEHPAHAATLQLLCWDFEQPKQIKRCWSREQYMALCGGNTEPTARIDRRR
jgi:hypothetical protein